MSLDLSVVEDMVAKSALIENDFEHRAVLFIPSESYCAATITIIQGLEELGFTIYTPFKSNINSWFCNKVLNSYSAIDDARGKVDFALSNLHWGTRWDFYNDYGFTGHFKVLIDGDDSRHGSSWRDRYDGWCSVYPVEIPEFDEWIKPQRSYRQMVPLGSYKPGIVFSSQKAFDDEDSVYLPFGIHRENMKTAKPAFQSRDIVVTNIPGDGPRRMRLAHFIDQHMDRFPSPIHNKTVRGEWHCDGEIHKPVATDPNIHSWSRWRYHEEYFKLLENSRLVINAGVFDHVPQWDSKRPWEAYASGAMVIHQSPNIDMSSYPVTSLAPWFVFDTYDELVHKCNEFARMSELFSITHIFTIKAALQYFGPIALARRFLWHVKEAM